MKAIPQITAGEAATLVRSRDVLIGGGGMTGHPGHLLHALAETGTGELTYVCNNAGKPGLGGGRLLRNGQARKAGGNSRLASADSPPVRQPRSNRNCSSPCCWCWCASPERCRPRWPGACKATPRPSR